MDIASALELGTKIAEMAGNVSGLGASLRSVVSSTADWCAPEPIDPPVFPENSVAVHIAVHAKKHRTSCGFKCSTMVMGDVKFAPTEDGKTALSVSIVGVGDKQVIETMEEKVPSDDCRFYFQPSFDKETTKDKNVNASLVCLHFSAQEIEVVRNNVSSVDTGGEKHIVMIVVAEDSPYNDLSAHLAAPDALETDDDRSNMMAIPLDKFVAGGSVAFIAPRMKKAKRSRADAQKDKEEEGEEEEDQPRKKMKKQ